MSLLLLEEVSSLDALQSLAPEWEELARSLPVALPFDHPWWHLRWFEHFAQDRAGLRDSLAVRTLRRTSGELVAVAPLMLTERPARGPMRMRTLQFIGADKNLTELRGVVCRPEDEGPVYRKLVHELSRRREGWDLVSLTGVRRGGVGESILLAQEGVELGAELPDYLLELPSSWQEFRAGLSRNIKESLRKCVNAPRRAGLSFTSHVVSEAPALAESVETFFALHGARARAPGTLVHSDAFAAPRAREFLRDLVRARAAEGGLRIFEQRHQGRVIASRIAFVLGEALYLYYSGYDPAYARYSVMTACVAGAIRHAIESGLKTVNLSTGNDVSKTRWGPRELLYRSALWVSPALRSRLVGHAWSALQEARAHPEAQGPLMARLLSLGARRHD